MVELFAKLVAGLWRGIIFCLLVLLCWPAWFSKKGRAWLKGLIRSAKTYESYKSPKPRRGRGIIERNYKKCKFF